MDHRGLLTSFLLPSPSSVYIQMSNPDGADITATSVDPGTLVQVEYRKADWRNWEKWSEGSNMHLGILQGGCHRRVGPDGYSVQRPWCSWYVRKVWKALGWSSSARTVLYLEEQTCGSWFT